MPKIFAVSDGTGTTADLVVRAALSQFDTSIDVRKFPKVRSLSQIDQVISQAVQERAIVVHTLVSEALRQAMVEQGKAHHLLTIDLMGPLLSRFAEEFAAPPKAEPGVFKPFADEYLRRMSALEFAVRHDDGQHSEELSHADIVLLGLSRTAKTPLSIHLAYQGWKVANVPIVLGLNPPESLYALKEPLVVGLQIDPQALEQLRRTGGGRTGTSPLFYADPENIQREIKYANEIYARGPGWPIIDITGKSIEFAAGEIMSLVNQHAQRHKRTGN